MERERNSQSEVERQSERQSEREKQEEGRQGQVRKRGKRRVPEDEREREREREGEGGGGSVCCTLCPENSFSPPRPGRKATPPHRITSEAEPAPSTTPPPHLPSLQVSPQPQPLSVYISKPTEMTEPSSPPWQTPLPGKSNGVKNILCFVLPDTLIFCAESPNFKAI